MILIADGGSTKTEWRLLGKTEERSMLTRGINPYHSSEKEIREELGTLDFHGEERNIHEIYFYGSGVANPQRREIIQRLLQERIGVHSYIQVYDDLLGAARALFLDKGRDCVHPRDRFQFRAVSEREDFR